MGVGGGRGRCAAARSARRGGRRGAGGGGGAGRARATASGRGLPNVVPRRRRGARRGRPALGPRRRRLPERRPPHPPSTHRPGGRGRHGRLQHGLVSRGNGPGAVGSGREVGRVVVALPRPGRPRARPILAQGHSRPSSRSPPWLPCAPRPGAAPTCARARSASLPACSPRPLRWCVRGSGVVAGFTGRLRGRNGRQRPPAAPHRDPNAARRAPPLFLASDPAHPHLNTTPQRDSSADGAMAARLSPKLAADAAAWAGNVVSSVAIIFINKTLMSRGGHGFVFGEERREGERGWWASVFFFLSSSSPPPPSSSSQPPLYAPCTTPRAPCPPPPSTLPARAAPPPPRPRAPSRAATSPSSPRPPTRRSCRSTCRSCSTRWGSTRWPNC